jgi:hypothetical protein
LARTSFLGAFNTATCNGAVSGAGGAQLHPVSAKFEVTYGFDGYLTPRRGTTVAKARVLQVEFRLAGSNSKALAAKTSAALARAGDIAARLAGPGIRAVSARCSWKSSAGYFRCAITLPAGVKTGRSHTDTVTATEKTGRTAVTAPVIGKAYNPVRFSFR